MSFGKFPGDLAFEIRNMRINMYDAGHVLSWTNEKGTKKLVVDYGVVGSAKVLDITTYLGGNVINDNIVIFCKGTIYRRAGRFPKGDYDLIIRYFIPTSNQSINKRDLDGEILYAGNLGFKTSNPIEAIPCYENEDIQKVYWTDGINQTRVINIASDYDIKKNWNDTSFDFVRNLELKEKVNVTRLNSGAGVFPCGTVQYAISYYSKNASESNIVYVSPLYYNIKSERGGSPEEVATDSYEIVVNNVDGNFEYIRLYSIIRTKRNSSPLVRIVKDKAVYGQNSIKFTDTNTTGEIVDSALLLSIGGEEIVAESIAAKNNTLFLGNIKLKRHTIDDSIKTEIKNLTNNRLHWGHTKRIDVNNGWHNIVYSYKHQLSKPSSEVKVFKYGEWYRFGIQFQHIDGKWSEVCYIGDAQNPIQPDMFNDINYFETDYALYAVPFYTFQNPALIKKLYNAGYRKARPVIVYTDNTDRSIIAQGVLCPTVYNRKYREAHVPDNMASWFFRPNEPKIATTPSILSLEYRDGKCIDNSVDGISCEVQSDVGEGRSIIKNNDVYKIDVPTPSASNYLVDRSVLTFNSPDLDFDDSLHTMDYSQFKVRIIGKMPVTAFYSNMYISPDIKGVFHQSYSDVFGSGWGNTNGLKPYDIWLTNTVYDAKEIKNNVGNNRYYIPVWSRAHLGEWDVNYNHKDGSDKEVAEYGQYDFKVFGSMRYSFKPIFDKPFDIKKLNTSDIQMFIDSELSTLNLKRGNELINYQANIDQIAPTHIENNVVISGKRGQSTIDSVTLPSYTYNVKGETMNNGILKMFTLSSDPVRIKYKSSPHAVIALNEGEKLSEEQIDNTSFLYIAEIYREGVTSDMRFGGDDEKALEDNVWLPCGDAVSFNENDTTISVDYTEGDYYFQRYDCLKTYPFADNDTNQCVEIGSFLMETRVNLDGRYDTNRGKSDNTVMSPRNFNKINEAYSQIDNYFTYMMLDESYKQNNFPDLITWSPVKVLGEDIDKWTNITLKNTIDADGTLGKVNKLINFNDNIMFFQDNGVAILPYNEKAAVQTDSGMKLDIASSSSVQEPEYMSKQIGCTNKWSVCHTPDNLFFIDDNKRALFRLVGGDKNSALENVGIAKLMESYFKENVGYGSWTPDFYNMKIVYDATTNDLLIQSKNKCLAFNDTKNIDLFTSMYEYGNIHLILNFKDKTIMFNEEGLWEARAGVYNTFFGKEAESLIDIVSRGIDRDIFADKVFNNIEYRADMFDDGHVYNPNNPFNMIRAYNEYQDSSCVFTDAEKRFRIWRANIPRDAKNIFDRIRNPWTHIILKRDAGAAKRELLLHDLIVYYDAK